MKQEINWKSRAITALQKFNPKIFKNQKCFGMRIS